MIGNIPCNTSVTLLTPKLNEAALSFKISFCYHNVSFMKTILLQALALGCLISSQPLHAQNSVSETRDVLDRWVETRQIISEEKADWRTEKSILSDTVLLLKNELERLEKDLEALQA